VGGAFVADEQAQRPAMRRQPLHVEDAQRLRRQNLRDGAEGQVGEMLVVDRVELVVPHQAEQMRKLEGGDTLGQQQLAEAAEKIMDIGDVREDVVRRDECCLAAACRDLAPRLRAEEHHLRVHTARLGSGGAICRGFDAGDPQAVAGEVLQQVAVIARDLGDVRVGTQAKARRHRRAVAFRMREPARGEGGEIGVVVGEDFSRLLELRELDQVAGFADLGVQRVEGLALLRARKGHEGIGQR